MGGTARAREVAGWGRYSLPYSELIPWYHVEDVKEFSDKNTGTEIGCGCSELISSNI